MLFVIWLRYTVEYFHNLKETEMVESGENKAPTLLQFLRYSPHKQNLQTTNSEKQLSSSPLETFRNLF